MLDENQDVTSQDGSNTQEVENINDSNIHWYDSKLMKALGGVTILTTIFACLFSLYNQYHKIPSLEEENKKYQQIINEKQKEINYLTSNSVVSQLRKENGNKDREIKLLESQVREIRTSRDQALNRNRELESIITQWKSAHQNIENNLKICSQQLQQIKANADLLNIITSLRNKIEQNNININKNGNWDKPTNIQIETWRLDNQSLNSMIKDYQQKLNCQQP